MVEEFAFRERFSSVSSPRPYCYLIFSCQIWYSGYYCRFLV